MHRPSRITYYQSFIPNYKIKQCLCICRKSDKYQHKITITNYVQKQTITHARLALRMGLGKALSPSGQQMHKHQHPGLWETSDCHGMCVYSTEHKACHKKTNSRQIIFHFSLTESGSYKKGESPLPYHGCAVTKGNDVNRLNQWMSVCSWCRVYRMWDIGSIAISIG